MTYENQEDFFDLDTEVEALTFFSRLQKKLPKKILQLKNYAVKFQDIQLNKLIENIENIINGYIDKKDIY